MLHEFWFRALVFAATGLGAGFLSGLFGIGGGIVRIPIFMALFPLFGIEQSVVMHVAIGTSVALVIPTAIIATRAQKKAGNFEWSFYRVWAVGLFAGVVLGMVLVPHLSTDGLKGVFAGFLILLGVYQGFAKPNMVITASPPSAALRLGLGALVGALAALTGTGGGALTTPTLKAVSIEFRRAVATASATGLVVGTVATAGMIITGWSVPGRPGHSLGYVDVVVFLFMLPTTLIGAPLGVKFNQRFPKKALVRIYTVLLFVIAANVISGLVRTR